VGLASLGNEGIAVAKQGLVDSDRDVQGAVAQALAQQGEAGQMPILEMLPRLGDKLRLLDALARTVPVPMASAPLQKIVSEGGTDAAMAAHILGEMRAKDAVPTLLKALDDRTGIARRDVLQALGSIGDPKAAEAIGRDLYHDSPEVRAAAADALAQLGNGAPLDALDALKGDYYRRVRESAEAALTKLGPASEAQR
jgi:HEAT repeat protein